MVPVLSIQGLGVRRNDELILRGVDWKIRPGENWAILGANGSGKTSLLSALTGYLTPSEGEIALLGQRFGQSDWRELRKQVGMVSSSVRQLMPEIEPAWDTVVSGKYAMIDLWEKPSREDRDKALRLLRQIGCLHLKDRRWGVLSQGERQRVLIARALMAQPKLLILDEPCAGLDPVAREHFLLFLDRLNERKNAPVMVLVTHHVEEITAAFTHALVLRRGSVLASGRKQTVLNSDVLSKAFDSPVRLLKSKKRCRIEVEPSKKIF